MGHLLAEQDRVARTDLGADLAAGAHDLVDDRQRTLRAGVEFIGLQDRRAADPETDRAPVARVGHRERQVCRLRRRQQRALLLGDEHRRAVLLEPGLELLLQSLDVVGLDGADLVVGETERSDTFSMSTSTVSCRCRVSPVPGFSW